MIAETSFGTRATICSGGTSGVVGMLGHQFHGGRAIERRPAGDEHVERAAEGVDVGTVIHGRGVAALLRGHIRRRSQSDSRASHVVRQRMSGRWRGDRPTARAAGQLVVVMAGDRGLDEPEIGDLHQPLLVEQEVVRLHVAMDHAAIVGVLEPAGRLKDVPDCRLGVELTRGLDELGQRRPRTYSMLKKRVPSASPMSWIWTMLGCESWAAA